MSGPHIWVPMHRFWWSDPRMPMFLQAQRLVTSPDSPDFFLLLSSSHFLRSFFNLFLSFFPNIPNISSPTRNYFKSRRTYICFPNVPYFPHQFSKFSHVPHHVLPPGRSPAWSAWWSSAWPCRVTPWWERAACGSLAAGSRPTSCRSGVTPRCFCWPVCGVKCTGSGGNLQI